MSGHIVKRRGFAYFGGNRGQEMSETLYAQVARDLTEAIANGRYPVGSLLPNELDLCVQYGASRHTVRTAIRELQELGLVTRRKKAGTRVEAASPARGYRQSLSSVKDLVRFGVTHTRVVREFEDVVTDRSLAKELGCAPGRRWLRISSLRMNGEPGAAPIGWTDVYVDAAYGDLRKVVCESPDVLISDLLESRYGRRVAEIRQDVHAVLVPEKLATELEVEAGTPALRIVRHYVDPAGEVVEISVTIHPADRFTFSLRLTRDKG